MKTTLGSRQDTLEGRLRDEEKVGANVRIETFARMLYRPNAFHCSWEKLAEAQRHQNKGHVGRGLQNVAIRASCSHHCMVSLKDPTHGTHVKSKNVRNMSKYFKDCCLQNSERRARYSSGNVEE